MEAVDTEFGVDPFDIGSYHADSDDEFFSYLGGAERPLPIRINISFPRFVSGSAKGVAAAGNPFLEMGNGRYPALV